MRKKCCKCNKIKNYQSFSNHKNRPDGLQCWCKICRKKYDYNRYRCLNKKEKYRLREKKKIQKLKNNIFIYKFLKTHPCIDCGEKDPIVLTFDHIKGKKKKDIASLTTYSIKTLQKEINKCVVRCCNCYIRKTAKSLNWKNKSNNLITTS